MKSLSLLRIEAEKACKFRGHNMSTFIKGEYYRDTREHAWCKYCGMQVTVNSKPQPNDIDIGGAAVALHCPES